MFSFQDSRKLRFLSLTCKWKNYFLWTNSQAAKQPASQPASQACKYYGSVSAAETQAWIKAEWCLQNWWSFYNDKSWFSVKSSRLEQSLEKAAWQLRQALGIKTRHRLKLFKYRESKGRQPNYIQTLLYKGLKDQVGNEQNLTTLISNMFPNSLLLSIIK